MNKVDTIIRHAWIIYATSKVSILNIQKDVDRIFFSSLGYSAYPENDWDFYGYRPPEGYQLLGAWRHPETMFFAFLLDSPHIQTIDPAIQLILYVAGDISEFNLLKSFIKGIKTKYDIEDKKHMIDIFLEERLRLIKSRSPYGLLLFLGIIAGIINIFSLYLRKIPNPTNSIPYLFSIYNFLINLIYIGSILLIIIIILLCGIYLIIYGYMLIKRLLH